jgi:hypothetical protein
LSAADPFCGWKLGKIEEKIISFFGKLKKEEKKKKKKK